MLLFDLIIQLFQALSSAAVDSAVTNPLAPGQWCVAANQPSRIPSSSWFSSFLGGIFGTNEWSRYCCATCSASAFTSVAASFATQGYYMQAAILDSFFSGGSGLYIFSLLAYVLAIIGALAGLALGQPPRGYLWFLVGPAMLYWILDHRYETHGVQWAVGNIPRDQRSVWMMSEIGLSGNRYIMSQTNPLDRRVYPVQPPAVKARVADLFAVFDHVVSDTVQQMVSWSGVLDMVSSTASGGTAQGYNYGNTYDPRTEPKWDLVSNLKWSMLDTITGARLKVPEVRDSLTQFMVSECGEIFNNHISSTKMRQATEAEVGSVYLAQARFHDGEAYVMTDFDSLKKELALQVIPSPIPLQRLIYKGFPSEIPATALTGGGAGTLLSLIENPPFTQIVVREGGYGTLLTSGLALSSLDASMAKGKEVLAQRIRCDDYFNILVSAFRWEAGHLYNTVVSSAPAGVAPDDVVFSLTYGWELKPFSTFGVCSVFGSCLQNCISSDGAETRLCISGSQANMTAAKQFLVDLILINLIRNEFLISPTTFSDPRYDSGQNAARNIEVFQSRNNQKTKFGEVYVWAQMIPHIQGVILYLLAAGFPFAVIFIVIPRLQKIVFTWGAFWIWVKLWDLGFAVVMTLERSLWGMLGSSQELGDLFRVVLEIGQDNLNDYQKLLPKSNFNATGGAVQKFSEVSLAYDFSFDKHAQIIDKGLFLMSSNALDLQNVYYIYIMSALYFAVPAITGQLVLGAKSGMSGMVQGAIGQTASQGGNAVGSSAVAQMQTDARQVQAHLEQGAMATSLRSRGLAARTIGAQNDGYRANYGQSQESLNSQGVQNSVAAWGDWTGNTSGVLGLGQRVIGSAQQSKYFAQSGRGGNTARAAPGPDGGQVSDAIAVGSAPGSADETPVAGGGAQFPTGGAGGDDPAAAALTAGDAGAVEGGSERSSGPTGAGRGAPTGDRVSSTLLGGVGHGVLHTAGVAASMGATAMQMAQGVRSNEGRTQAFGHSIEGARLGQRGSMYSMRGQRRGAQMRDLAARDVWDAKRDYANKMTQFGAAVGVFAGTFDPGNQPTDGEALASYGQADTYSSNGGKESDVSSEYARPFQGGTFDKATRRGGDFTRDAMRQNQHNADIIRSGRAPGAKEASDIAASALDNMGAILGGADTGSQQNGSQNGSTRTAPSGGGGGGGSGPVARAQGNGAGGTTNSGGTTNNAGPAPLGENSSTADVVKAVFGGQSGQDGRNGGVSGAVAVGNSASSNWRPAGAKDDLTPGGTAGPVTQAGQEMRFAPRGNATVVDTDPGKPGTKR